MDLEGKTQIFTPDVTSMLTAQYSYLISARNQIKLVVRGEWFYLGKRYFDLSNNISQSPYSLLNTSLGVSRKNQKTTGRRSRDAKTIQNYESEI